MKGRNIMNKEKRVIIITIVLMSLVLACVMFMQFKVVNETDIAEIESMREDELQEALSSWKEKYTEIDNKLEDTENKIKEYKEKSESSEETNKLVEKELEEANIILGKTDVTGNGIQIVLTDNDNQEYAALDLLNLINELRAAGAEAISINGERVINLTDIVDISNRYILVNSNKISSPYTILAIGDENYLKSALSIKNGYVDIKQKEGYTISIESKNNLKINKYSKEINLKYIDI